MNEEKSPSKEEEKDKIDKYGTKQFEKKLIQLS